MNGESDRDARYRIPWPLWTLDFEASGLGEFTYPIEIGLAVWSAPDAPIVTWSSLIRPSPNWRAHWQWHAAAEAVHSIRKDQLNEGLAPSEALAYANELVGSHVAYCDGGEHDLRWLLHLAHSAGFPPSFRLADWDCLGGLLSGEEYSRMIAWLEGERIVHRAAADAERLLRAVKSGLGVIPSLGQK